MSSIRNSCQITATAISSLARVTRSTLMHDIDSLAAAKKKTFTRCAN